MLFKLPNIISLRIFFVLLYLNSLSIYCQKEPSERHVQEKLQHIDANTQNKQYDSAINKIEEIESYSNYISDDKNRLTLQFKKAKVYYENGDQQKAIDLLLAGLGDAKILNNLDLKIKYSQYLGEIFKSVQNYNKSRFYNRIFLNNSELKLDTINILKSYLAIGSTFYDEINYDSATYYYRKVVDFPITIQTNEAISDAYNNLSVIANQKNDLILAEEYGSKSLEIIEQQKDTLDIAIALINISNILFKKEEYVNAKSNYIKAYESLESLNSDLAIRAKENVLYNLAFVSEELGNFKEAYFYLNDASILTDSLAQASVAQNISEIEAKYNVAKEAQKVEVEKSKRLRAQVFFFGLAFAFLAFIVFGYIFYRNYRLKQRNKLEQIENETQTRIINATIDAKEKERKSIAEILHDSVSALLSSANLHLQATKAQLKKEAPQEISKAQVIVNEASVKIRDLSHELISSVLLKFGLAFAVHDMCQKYSNSKITLHSDDNGIKRYEQDFEIKIHNIVEELINNILKHSDASNATIMLAHRENDMLSIRISDDGKGFNVKTARDKDGLGLSHINARIKVMKGVFNIVSSKGNGTSIFILVPIQHKKVA